MVVNLHDQAKGDAKKVWFDLYLKTDQQNIKFQSEHVEIMPSCLFKDRLQDRKILTQVLI